MAKDHAFVCESCGHDSGKWLGRCPSCHDWNTFREVRIPLGTRGSGARGKAGTGTSGTAGSAASGLKLPVLLSEVESAEPMRHPTGIAELDRVLGGGLAPGTSILLGGEPGIGKSTLMLQVAGSLPGSGLYVSGEESAGQIKNRAQRIGLKQESLGILCETDLDVLVSVLETRQPDFVVIDSIQTLSWEQMGLLPGSPNQLRSIAMRLASWAKETGTPVIFIAHVTKEGTIAGPKVVEHLVDTVLYFDHSSDELRILRAVKNRMGSVDEVGLFTMSASGLVSIGDPVNVFLRHRGLQSSVGSAVAAVHEGSRILLLEIQALTVPAGNDHRRFTVDRIDRARVGRISAVLERHAGLKLSDQDIYVNVAGGLRISDTGADLALALALLSARAEKPLPPDLVSVGEITLAGEVRTVPHLRRRLKTAMDSGFSRWLAAHDRDESGPFPGQHAVARTVSEALALAGSL